MLREPDRPAGKNIAGQRDIERKWRVIASAESAADIGEMRIDMRRLVCGLGFAEQIRDRFSRLVGRLHADHQFEILAAGVVPSEAAFRLEKHRVNGLSFELPLQHQMRRIIRRKLGANLFAVVRRLRVVLPGGNREPRPDRVLRVLEYSAG